ncbi:hypothetical protein ACQKLP_20670 [Chitinophaga sp. NPDC101104]|uniref:hypothetical protein n=1 Tax=Chitinophaga sp. NPDC101104 TaxID=3390561 RepID=UPI003D0229F5
MDTIDTFAKYYLDSEKPIEQRIFTMMFMIGIVLFVNDTLKFTYYYRLQHKMNGLHELTAMITDPETDSIGKAKAAALREELLQEEPVLVDSYFFLMNHLNGAGGSSTSTKNKLTPNKTIGRTIAKSITSSIINDFTLIISSIGIFLVVGIMTIARAITKRRGSFLGKMLASFVWFAALVVIVTMIHLFFLLGRPTGLSWRGVLVFNASLQFILLSYVVLITIISKNRSR